jgi:hypothetical protein
VIKYDDKSCNKYLPGKTEGKQFFPEKERKMTVKKEIAHSFNCFNF